MSSVFLIAGILAAVLVFTSSYYKKQQRHQNAKPGYEERRASSSSLEFPQNYGKNQLTLLVRDPEWLHAYWEITDEVQGEFSKQFGDLWNDSRAMLRIYDVTGGEQLLFKDIQIQDYAGSWYIHVGSSNHTFFVDLGRLLPDGRFYRIARSNSVTTPSNCISDVIDPNWVPIEAIWSSLSAQGLESLSSQELLERRSD